MIKPWRALIALLLALCLPLQGMAASGGWWCASQGHDPLRIGTSGAVHSAHGLATPAKLAQQAAHAAHADHGHHGSAPAVAAPADPGLAGAALSAGSCSVCAACCAVAWLPPATWRTPEVPDATPWLAAQAGWPPRLALANLDRPPRSLSV